MTPRAGICYGYQLLKPRRYDMPVSKERFAENQRARRLTARPHSIYSAIGKATETPKVAPAQRKSGVAHPVI